MIKFISYYSVALIVFLLRLYPKRNNLIILNYHRILDEGERPFSVFDRLSTKDFDEQLFFLKRFFNILPLDEALVALSENRLVPNSLSITFDDGYVECFEKVFPILKRNKLSACFFITTGGMRNGKTWETEIESCIETAYEKNIMLYLDDFLISTANKDKTVKTTKYLTQLIKYKTLTERNKIIALLKSQVGEMVTRCDYMSPEQVKQLAQGGMIIGAHTENHPILSLEDLDTCKAEVVASKKILEEITGHSIDMFAYPNGKFGVDFNASTIQVVQNAGFRFALSSDWGVCSDLDSEKYKIKRLMPWDKKPLMYILRIVWAVLFSKKDKY